MQFKFFKSKKDKDNNKNPKKKSKEKKSKKDKNTDENTGSTLFQHNTIVDAIIPNSINPRPHDYMLINNTRDIYTKTLYVQSIPKKSRFAYTFQSILKYPNSNVTVYVDPIPRGKAVTELDKDIITLDTERMESSGKDRNRERKLSKKLGEAESLSDTIDGGDNQLFNIAIFVTLYAKSLDELDKAVADICYQSKGTGIQLAACYSYHEQGLKVCSPIGVNDIGYWHQVDKYSLATLFHYTTSDFSHEKGALLGRNTQTGRHIFYYLFHPSLRQYNAIITGISGGGKSVLIKKIAADHIEMGCKVICLDSDSPDNEGEYAKIARKMNGMNVEIHSKSKHVLNPFDLEIEFEYDEATGLETPALNLQEKILDATNILLTLARGNTNKDNNRIDEITRQMIQDVVAEEYAELEIYDGKPESLFTTGKTLVKGKLTSGKVKKEMPTLSSWYQRLCSKQDELHGHPTYGWHYDYLKMVMKDWVRGIGTRPYFDGQSTMTFDSSIPFINIDVHRLHETYERPIAQIIALTKIWEDYFKKNSENPFNAEELLGIFDEVHMLLPFPEARFLLKNIYKRIRKKNGGVISATQEISEFKKYSDAEGIITNAETKIIGKQDELLADEVQDILKLTESELYAVLSFDKPGMFLLKSKNKKIFFQSDMLDIEKEAMETNKKEMVKLRKGKSA
jgi:type IV secretory pathway VirB4 component